MTHYDVIVIGGGASGMMAAGVAASRGQSVLVLEKNKNLGEKLKISGGGRCNVTNAEFDVRALLKHYGPAEQFLYSPFSQFGVQDTIKFFESRGLGIVVTDDRKRAFPETYKALDVFRVLEKYMKDGGVTIKTNSKVTRINSENGIIKNVIADGVEYSATSFIVATGGMSHPETGSTGDGFGWLRDLGHSIADPSPTIVPLAVQDAWVHALAGVSFADSKITFYVDSKKSFSKTGSILCTHFGISGPTILNSSKQVADLLHEGEVTAIIDCCPSLDEGAMETKILEVFDSNKNKLFKNVFSQLAPAGSASVLLDLLKNIDPEKPVHSITKDERKEISKLLKNLPMTITGLMGFDRAVVADGGVPLTEINMKTMQSLKIPNLFVTGDLLHINRPSGGYSLQLCWTTGFVTGMNV